MSVPTPPIVSVDHPDTALRALSGIVERLSAGDALDVAVPDVLTAVARAVSAREVAVWLHSPAGLTRAWSVGEPETTAAWLTAALSQPNAPRDNLRLVLLSTGGRRLGVLAVVPSRPLGANESVVVSAVGQLLAPAVAHSEQQRQLEVEVAARTRQIDEERRFTERIIDSLPVGLYVIDREYRIQAWNRKRETGMQGVSREEAIGRPIFEILHRQPGDLLRREFDEVFASGRLQSFQVESLATGELRTYRISKIPMRLDAGEVTHVVTIGEDVTEWKEAQERFSQSEKLAAIGQLAAGVMHEINNPLATIAACAESLGFRLEDLQQAGADVPSSTTDFLRIIDDEVHRCKQIVDGLLDFSRPKQVLKERVDLNEVVDKTLFLLKHHARFKKLSVAPLLDRELPPLTAANAEQLVQVFMALLLNALDAMGDRGTVTIRTLVAPDDPETLIAEVIDQGVGIQRSELTKIFEPFYTTKGAGQGTGLGLAICYGIVQEHGGRIEVDSVLGEGSTFRVLLPLGGA
jgi:two-component system, NtrC family, sensor kinase